MVPALWVAAQAVRTSMESTGAWPVKDQRSALCDFLIPAKVLRVDPSQVQALESGQIRMVRVNHNPNTAKMLTSLALQLD